MLYSIVGIDHPDSLQARMAVRSEHVARLKDLLEQGRLIIAGPNPAIDSDDPGEAGFSGSINVTTGLKSSARIVLAVTRGREHRSGGCTSGQNQSN